MTDDGPRSIVESASGIISEAAGAAGARRRQRRSISTPLPVFTYLANTIRIRDREIPYSLVDGVWMFACCSMLPRRRRPDRQSSPDLGSPIPGPGRDRAERLDRARAGRGGRRSRRDRVLPVGRRRRHAAPTSATFTVAARGADEPAGRGSASRAGVSGHHRRGEPRRLGPAVSARPRRACESRTRTTGTNIARRPRPSSRTSALASCGRRDTATSPDFDSLSLPARTPRQIADGAPGSTEMRPSRRFRRG